MQFSKWLHAVKAEIETPDVWAIARAERDWLTSTEAAFSGNTPFNAIEKEQIAHHLRAIEKYAIKTYKLQAEEAEFVRGRLRYLTEAVDRVGRFDWKGLAASTFMTIVITLGLDKHSGEALLTMATELLGSLSPASQDCCRDDSVSNKTSRVHSLPCIVQTKKSRFRYTLL